MTFHFIGGNAYLHRGEMSERAGENNLLGPACAIGV
jgi:hypothetical protein